MEVVASNMHGSCAMEAATEQAHELIMLARGA